MQHNYTTEKCGDVNVEEIEYEMTLANFFLLKQHRKILELEQMINALQTKKTSPGTSIGVVELKKNKLNINRKEPDAEINHKSSRYWTPDEHDLFLEGLERFGEKGVKQIALHVGTRTATQVRTHLQKFNKRLERMVEENDIPDNLSNRNAASNIYRSRQTHMYIPPDKIKAAKLKRQGSSA